MLWFRLAWKEIRNHRRFSLFFVFNLAIGLSGFIGLDAFKNSIQTTLESRSKSILTADLSLSARRPLRVDEAKQVDEVFAQAIAEAGLAPGSIEEMRVLEFYSMIASPEGKTRLAEVRAIEDRYPFYGQLRLQNSGAVRLENRPVAWAYPELLPQLDMTLGQSIRLGEARFELSDVVLEDSGNSWRGISLAPRIYIGLGFVESTGLLKKGSTISHRRLYRLPESLDSEALGRELDQALKDPEIQVITHRAASAQVGRLLGYINDYLGLVALVALLFAGVGAGYLFRSFISRRSGEIAILMSLGALPGQARRVFLIQLMLLGGAAAGLSALGSMALLPLFTRALQGLVSIPLTARISPATVGLAFLMGTLGSLLICLPLLQRLRSLKPQGLFQENALPQLEGRSSSWTWGLIAVVFWLAAVLQAHSWRVGSLFTGGVLAAGILLGAIALGAVGLLARLRWSGHWMVRLGARSLARNRLSTVSCFLALGLGSLLLNLIPQIQQALEQELVAPQVSRVPDLFLFDIQDEQVEPLRELAKSQAVEIEDLSPLVRARLISINEVPFEKLSHEAQTAGETREEEQERRSRNRGYNLTDRERLSEAESITDGVPFSGRFDPAAEGTMPEISVEEGYAKRVGLKLGDVLEFDIQGVPVRGKIVNFRKVQWTSFRPNFFVVFQPGALEGAPRTFLASLGGLTPERKMALQEGIVSRFPNISLLDVSRLVERLLDIFTQMSLAVRWMAYLALGAGMVVLFSIAHHQSRARRREAQLLKVLGAEGRQVATLLTGEFSVLGAASAAFGAILSLAMSFAIGQLLFDGLWVFSWKIPLLATLGISALGATVAFTATRFVLREKPLALLQAERE